MPATIDTRLINRSITTFPFKGNWSEIDTSDISILHPNSKRSFKPLSEIRALGAVYAFLAPRNKFKDTIKLSLHTPNKGTYPLHFKPKSHLAAWFVLYVGKTTNFQQRHRGHFSPGHIKTGNQVLKGLKNCRKCVSDESAIQFLQNHSRLIYLPLDGQDHIANRELIELSLTVKYTPPFNIKAER